MNAPLEKRFLSTLHQHPQREAIWRNVATHYSEPQRAYHNLHHIAACLNWFDNAKQHAADALSLELAIWLHDVIYQTRPAGNHDSGGSGKDNELLSAEFAARHLGSGYDVAEIQSLILATRHKDVELPGDAALMCDIDLTILAADEDAYATYQHQIRQEYAWAPDDAYREGRGKVLQSFLQRDRIFRTTPMLKLESAARENLTRELAHLKSG